MPKQHFSFYRKRIQALCTPNIVQHHQISPNSAYMSAARLSSGPWSTVATRHMTPEQVHE